MLGPTRTAQVLPRFRMQAAKHVPESTRATSSTAGWFDCDKSPSDQPLTADAIAQSVVAAGAPMMTALCATIDGLKLMEQATQADLQKFRDEMMRLHAKQPMAPERRGIYNSTDNNPGRVPSFDPVHPNSVATESSRRPGTNSRVRAVKTIRPSRNSNSNLYV